MEILPNDSVAEADSLSKSPQLDVLLAGYAVQRADCSAIYGSSINLLGLIVATMGLVSVVVGDPVRIPPMWLAFIAVFPWGVLAHHSLMVGMNAGHSYVCEVYERLIAEVAPKGLLYKENGKGEGVILGVTVGERFLDLKRASASRRAATVFALLANIFLPLWYSVAIIVNIWGRSVGWFCFSVAVVSMGFFVVGANIVGNVRRVEVNLLESFRRSVE